MKSALLLLAFSVLALADIVPVTWTGNPGSTLLDCGGCPFGGNPPMVTETQDGPDVDFRAQFFSTAIGFGPYSDSMAYGTFSISYPADITLAITVGYSSTGNSCADTYCPDLTSWNYSGGFSGGIGISGPNGAGIGMPFGNSATVAGTCGEIAPGDCSGQVSFFDSQSVTMFLPAGDYAIGVDYSDSDSSIGDSWEGAYVDAVISDPASAVPEPRGWVFSAAFVLLGIVVGRVLKRTLR